MKKDDIKKRIYEVIEASAEKDTTSKAYDAMIYVAVIVGLIPLTIKTESIYTTWIDIITVAIFLADYVMRLYTADYKMGVKSWRAYMAYVVSPMAIIDLLSIVPILYVIFPSLTIMRYFRLFRIFRILKLVRYTKVMTSIENVLRRVKNQLFGVLMLTLVYIAATAMVLFQLEPQTFGNYLDALYWSAMSITTIGYGDIAPVTTVGRMITMLSALVGVAVIALPSGLITAAYMDEIKKKKGKHEL